MIHGDWGLVCDKLVPDKVQNRPLFYKIIGKISR